MRRGIQWIKLLVFMLHCFMQRYAGKVDLGHNSPDKKAIVGRGGRADFEGFVVYSIPDSPTNWKMPQFVR